MDKDREPDIQPINDVDSLVVETHFDFPSGIDIAQKIGLDVKRLEKLCYRIGVSRLRILGVYRDKDSSSTMILGHDGHGTAFGGFAKTKDLSRSTIMPDHEKWESLFRVNLWDKATIELDKEAVQEAIMEKGSSLRNTAEWTKILDEKLKSELRKVARKTTFQPEKGKIARRNAGVFFAASWLIYFTGYIKHASSFNFRNIEEWMLIALVFVINYFPKALHHEDTYDQRISILNFLGREVDSYLIFLCQLSVSTLVHEIVPPDEKTS